MTGFREICGGREIVEKSVSLNEFHLGKGIRGEHEAEEKGTHLQQIPSLERPTMRVL
jgi:hypothetical protein